jgi:acyl-CoA reductase-like NAD-dependent aldehyde dehydrogenase
MAWPPPAPAPAAAPAWSTPTSGASLARHNDGESIRTIARATKVSIGTVLRRGHRVAHQLKTGTVYLNQAHRRNPGAPFGGYRHSGLGAEGGRAGLDEFLRQKTIGIA